MKKVLAILAVTAIVFVGIGCGAKEEPAATPDKGTTGTTGTTGGDTAPKTATP